MKKRALSWLLALAMLLTLAPQTLPVWASATGEKSNTATQTESKLSANTYSALGLSRNVSNSEKPAEQPYGKAEVGNTIATNVINELYVNFNGSIHYGWSILDNIPMEYKLNISNWTDKNNFYGAMDYWRPNQRTVNFESGSDSKGALFAKNGSNGGEHDKIKDSINSANKHLVYQYSKSEAFSPNTGKDNYVAELVVSDDGMVSLYIYQVEGGNKRYVRGTNIGKNPYVGDANDKTNIIWNWEYDAMFDIAAGDMDGDGYDEIAVYTATSDKQEVHLYKYTGGALTEITTKPVTVPSNSNATGQNKKLGTAVVTLAFGDLNADDKDELVIAENMPYWSRNIEKGTVGIYALENKQLEPKHNFSLQYNNDPYAIRYVNVATGDIDGDNKDELIAAGYYSEWNNNAKCSRDNIWYNIVKVEDGKYKNSGWKSTEFKTQDLLGRVVDNEKQLIPPVALTCAATQGVGYAEQVFLGGCLYTVKNDNSLEYLTRISTNREYKKDDGKKANKEEIFVVNVVAGNFNGNRNGQEQIVYAFGMKHDDSDRYWYDIGYINKKNPGNSDSDYWYGQEQVMNFESSYNRDQNKRRASLYLSLAAVDCDDDSTLMRYKGQEVTWTKPEVLTILQSAPYFQDLEDTRGYINQGQTGYGKGKGSGSSATAGTSLSVGTYVSFEQDFSVFGVKIASIQAEAQTKHSFNYGYEHNQTVETEVNYSGSAGDDYAVVYAVPYMEYQYETWVPGYKLPATKNDEYYKYVDNYLSGKLKDWDTIKTDSSKLNTEREKAEKELGISPNMEVKGSWQPCTVSVPMTPRTVMLSVDDYDDIANVTEGLQPIRGNILNSTPGDPTTYDVENSRKDFNKIGTLQTVTKAQGSNISVTQTATTEEEHSFEYDYEFEAKVGAGAGGLTVGVLAGFGANAGGGISTSTSKSYSATVDNLPSDADGYALSWQFGWRKAKLNNNDVLVLEYQQKDTKAKPSPPKNLRVESVTSNSVTLTWDPVTGAGAYKIYQVEKSSGDLFEMKTLAGTATSWTHEKLNSNSSYIYVAETVTQSGETSITSKEVNASTLEANGNFIITKQPELTETTYAGGEVNLSVEAEYLNADNTRNELHYQWQVYDRSTKQWKSLRNGNGATYTAMVTDENDGDRYRCRVYHTSNLYLYSTEVTLNVGLAKSATTLTPTYPSGVSAQAVKSTYFITEKVTVAGEYEDVPVIENGRTKYSYQSGNETKYVYVATTIDADKKENYHYYGTSDSTNEITQVEQQVLTFGDESYDINLTGGQTPTGTKTYTVSREIEGVTQNTIYTAEKEYTLNVGESSQTIKLYYCPETDTKAEFWFVEVTKDNHTNQYVADVETVKKLTIDDNTLIDISSLTVCTEKSTKEATTTVQKKQVGDTVKLAVNVADANTGNNKIPTGSVTFKVVNTTGDGGFTKDVEIKDGMAEISWNPTTSGVYTVTAIYSGSDIFKESQSQIITINVVTPGEKKLVVSGENMTYGESQTLTATLFDGGSAENISAQTVDAAYTVSYNGGTATALNGSTFTPDKAGTYTITASYKPTGSTTAITSTKVITVNRKTVTVVPKVDDTDGNLKADYDIYDGTRVIAKTTIPEANIKVTCGAIPKTTTSEDDTTTTTKPGAGIYPITVTYTAHEDTDAKYLVVCDNSKTYEIKDDVIKVTNDTKINSNGKVTLSYIYKDHTYEVVSQNGGVGYIPKEAKLTATAQPNVGYRVEKWLVDNNIVYMTDGHTPNTENTITVRGTTNTDVTVEAAFTQIYYPVRFGFQTAGDGTITAKYVNDNGGTGTVFNSGSQLSPLQKIQLTAKPENGQVISGWQIKTGNDVKTVTNKDGTNYTGNTYTLSAISGETEVTVLTEFSTEYPVTVKLVDEKNNPLGTTNATVSFDPADQETTELNGTYNYPGQKHQDLTISLNIQDSLIVDSWTAGEGQTMPGTLSANKKKLTISNLQGDAGKLDLTVKCVTPNMYPVTVESNGNGSVDIYKNLESTALTLTNHSVDVQQASSLRVVLKPEEGYQVLSVKVDNNPLTTLDDVANTAEGKAFTINSVDGPTTINVQFVKKPVISFSPTTATTGAYGSVTANNIPISRGTVPYGSKDNIVFTATPHTGYEVATWTVNGSTVTGTPVPNSDDQTYTYTPDATTGITSDVTVKVSFKELPTATVNFSVVDKNGADQAGGFDGSVTASVARKGMAAYTESKTANSSTSTQTLTVYRDSTVALSAQADTGYVAKWIYNGQESLTPPTLDFSSEDKMDNHNVQVRFDSIGKEITFGKEGEHSSAVTATFQADGGNTEKFASGNIPNTNGTLTLTVTPNDGYEVEGWYVNGHKQDGSAKQNTFEYPVKHDVGAAIQVKIIRSSYAVNFSAVNGNIAATKPTNVTIESGDLVQGDTSVTFTATPAQPTGYTFDGWKINGETADQYNEATVNNQSLSLVIKEPVRVAATYTQDATRHTVTYGVDGETLGTLTTNLSASPATIANGGKATFTATPKEGNYVVGWYSDAACTQRISETGEETSYSVDVYNDTTVYVKFAVKPPYTISLAKNGNGKVFASVNDGAETEVTGNTLAVKYHDKVVFRAQADDNHYFVGWKDNTKGTYTIADVTGPASVTAIFAPTQSVYLKASSTNTSKDTLTATGSVTGSIATNTDGNGVQVAGGEKITLTAHPVAGQMVKEWKIGTTVQSGNLSNTLVIDSITESTTVTVEFEDYVGYTIPTTPTTEAGYTVKDVVRIPDDTPKDGKIRKGGTVTFTVVPDSNKVFNQLKVGNIDCLSTPSTGDVTAVREGNGYRITISNVAGEINLTATAIEFQVIKNELTQVPEGLTEKYATPEAMKSALRTQISPSVSGSNIKYLDIKLKINTGSGWQDVTAANFPKGGINITISYGTLGNGLDKSYNYSVAHMRTDGTIENLPATNGESGITFHVNSLSPFAIGWYKNTPTPGGGGGGGGGGAVSTCTLTFDTNGGSAIDKITKDSGTTIDLTAYKPTRAGYTFAGWFSDKALTKAVTSVKLTANTTVYAKWTQNGGTAENPFVDVKEGAYYYDAVLWAVEQKITSGTSATTFSPDASCTRAQMVTFLWRAAGSPKVENGKNPFADVKADAYYYDAVLWAVEKGVTSGTSATTFSPDATVTRGQTVTFLYRNAGSPEVSGTMPFTDVEADAYYAKAVQWAVQQKITTGTSETTFSPMSDCTRGQIVTFLYRAK